MKRCFSDFPSLVVTSVSPWVQSRASRSPIMDGVEQRLVLNGVNDDVFRIYAQQNIWQQYGIDTRGKRVVLYVTACFYGNRPEKGSEHLLRLAEQMTDEYTTCTALLHDVVEDTCVTLEDLKEIFPPEVTDAVSLMTHNPSVPYMEYVKTIKQNPVARAVKIADLIHNSDTTRIIGTNTDPESVRMRLEKYQAALKILL